MLGYKAIPDIYKGGIPALADKKFDFTQHTFNTIVASTEKHALELIAKTGGRATADPIAVRTEDPKAPKLEVWDDFGSPAERVLVQDARWTFTGTWKDAGRAKLSGEKGASAAIEFEGTGAIIAGTYLTSGGKLQVFVDGKPDRTLDVYSDEKGNRGGESVWHAFGLKNGKHQIRLVVSGETYQGSTGTDVSIDDLVVFK